LISGNSGAKDGIYWCKFVGQVFNKGHGDYVGDPGCADLYKVISSILFLLTLRPLLIIE